MTKGKTTEILKSEIDLDDFSFRFGKNDKKDELARSIDQYGILENPVVIKGKDKYKIFSGFNRLEVSPKNQNLFSVIIINEVTEDLFEREVGKKLYHDRIGISGKVRLCEIYENFFSQAPDQLKKTARSIGGIPADFFPGSENFCKLAGLNDEFRDFLDEKDIAFKVVRNFLSLSSSSQERVIFLVIKWNPGKNNFKKLIDIILDIEQQGDRECFMEEISEKEGDRSFDELYSVLSVMRYPLYTKMLAEKDRLLKLLNIPSVHFVVPEFFEGDEIFLQARIKRNEKPEDVFKKINGIDRDVIAELLHLL